MPERKLNFKEANGSDINIHKRKLQLNQPTIGQAA